MSGCALKEVSGGNDSDQTKKDQVAIGPQGANKRQIKTAAQAEKGCVEVGQPAETRRWEDQGEK